MAAQRKYPDELRERAVKMVARAEPGSDLAAELWDRPSHAGR